MTPKKRQTTRTGELVSIVLGVVGFLVLVPTGHGRPVAEANHIKCGDLLEGKGTFDSTFTLDSDVGPCPGPGPALAVGKLTLLDLAGFTVSCDGFTPFMIGVDLVGKNSVLKNGNVTNCFINVRAGARSHILVSVQASLGVVGFLVPEGSDGNRFTDTTADQNGGVGYLIDGDQNRVGKFSLSGREDVNTASSNGIGFVVRGRQNRLEDTVAVGNTVEGYTVFGKENRFTQTQATMSPNGYSFLGNLNTANLNTATGNTGAGIGNRGKLNDFYLNTAVGNGLDLFDANQGCDTTKWRRNSFSTSQDGEPPGPVNNPSICIQ